MKTVLAVIGAIVIIIVLGMFAVCGDGEDEALRLQLAGHEYDERGDYSGDQDYDQGNQSDRNRNRNRERGAFSPGPFDDSPVDAFNNVCMPGATCHYNPPPEEGEPA